MKLSKKISVLFIALQLINMQLNSMIDYPVTEEHSTLPDKIDVDFTSPLNTEDEDGVEFDIGPEMPSFTSDYKLSESRDPREWLP